MTSPQQDDLGGTGVSPVDGPGPSRGIAPLPPPRDPAAHFVLEGGPVGVLLVHGFTAVPGELRLIAEHLHARGLTVSCPLLPGHGTSPADLARRRRREWTLHVTREFDRLRRRCSTAFAAGQSLGALLALDLAAVRDDLAGVIAYAPPVMLRGTLYRWLPLGRLLLRSLPRKGAHFADPAARARLVAYPELPLAAAHEVLLAASRVRSLLPLVRCPLLVIHSRADRTVHPAAPDLVVRRAGSRVKELVLLHESGHSLPLDLEWPTVAAATLDFVQRHTPDSVRAPHAADL